MLIYLNQYSALNIILYEYSTVLLYCNTVCVCTRSRTYLLCDRINQVNNAGISEADSLETVASAKQPEQLSSGSKIMENFAGYSKIMDVNVKGPPAYAVSLCCAPPYRVKSRYSERVKRCLFARGKL